MKTPPVPRCLLPLASAALLLGAAFPALAGPAPTFNTPNSPNLPARRLEPGPRPQPRPLNLANVPARFPAEFRPITGAGTNPAHPDWGNANTPFLRLAPAAYGDGVDSPAGANRPSPRAVSNAVVAQSRLIPNARGASAMVWQWGQFLDHDLDLSPVATPAEEFDVPVPAGDPSFDPAGTGNAVIALDRTLFLRDAAGIRQQVNDLTAFIDGSQVYGADETRARALRTFVGGRMKTGEGNLLPFNVDGLANAPAPSANFFVAGDFRVNEQVGLMAIQTLFLREHNYWADQIRRGEPTLTDEQIYQRARAMVGAEIQAITYREFLPVLLGPNALRPYRGYRPDVNPGIANEFATAAYRVGHTMLSPTLPRRNADGGAHAAGELSLVASFFNVGEITTHGIEPILSGLTFQVGQEVDRHLVDEVRNFLFGAPGSPGFDLASLNIQRGRDHRLPGYNAMRRALGLPGFARFTDLTPDRAASDSLAKVYASVEDIDLWVGGLVEPHVPGAMVGPTFHAILRDQFERLRDGDRFWYQSYLPAEWARVVEQQTLATILRRNAVTAWKYPDNAFVVAPKAAPIAAPSKNPKPKPGRTSSKKARPVRR